MKRIRYLIVAALAAASVGIAAPPASACPPDEQMPCPPCGNETIDAVWRKITGHNLFVCPY
ncbi:MAG: hypothetical protein M3271_00785 [Actinomycetota bacterium]|nr:hypothetical protein [Actinomycetota bacterium]